MCRYTSLWNIVLCIGLCVDEGWKFWAPNIVMLRLLHEQQWLGRFTQCKQWCEKLRWLITLLANFLTFVCQDSVLEWRSRWVVALWHLLVISRWWSQVATHSQFARSSVRCHRSRLRRYSYSLCSVIIIIIIIVIMTIKNMNACAVKLNKVACDLHAIWF